MLKGGFFVIRLKTLMKYCVLVLIAVLIISLTVVLLLKSNSKEVNFQFYAFDLVVEEGNKMEVNNLLNDYTELLGIQLKNIGAVANTNFGLLGEQIREDSVKIIIRVDESRLLPQLRGPSVYYIGNNDSRIFANSIQGALNTVAFNYDSKELSNPKRRAKSLGFSDYKDNTLIISLGFYSNIMDRELMMQESYKELIINSIINGISSISQGVNKYAPVLAQNNMNKYSLREDLFFLPMIGYEKFNYLPVSYKDYFDDVYSVNNVIDNFLLLLDLKELPTELIKIKESEEEISIDFDRVFLELFKCNYDRYIVLEGIILNLNNLCSGKRLELLVENKENDIFRTISNKVLPFDNSLPPLIAIIIDDYGNNQEASMEFLDIGIPITAAIMPFSPFATEEARLIQERGHEIIIHLPMEAKTGKREWLGKNPILTSSSNEEVKDILDQAFDAIPYAVGINNHMGSKATENERIVNIVVDGIRDRSLFVLDSGTSPNSKVIQIAKAEKVPYGIRDIFLDGTRDQKQITKQINKLYERAIDKGYAIGIGHVGNEGGLSTYKALRASLKRAEQLGIEFVYLSDLIKGSYYNGSF